MIFIILYSKLNHGVACSRPARYPTIWCKVAIDMTLLFRVCHHPESKICIYIYIYIYMYACMDMYDESVG